MKKLFFTLIALVSAQLGMAQSLNKMQWFNGAEQWDINAISLTLFVTGHSV